MTEKSAWEKVWRQMPDTYEEMLREETLAIGRALFPHVFGPLSSAGDHPQRNQDAEGVSPSGLDDTAGPNRDTGAEVRGSGTR